MPTPYCTAAQVMAEIRLFKRQTIPDLDNTFIEGKIVETDALIEGYLRRVYILPFQKSGSALALTPTLVTMISTKLTAAIIIDWIFDVKSAGDAGPSTSSRINKRYMAMLVSMIAQAEAAPLLDCDYQSNAHLNSKNGFDILATPDNLGDLFPTVAWSTTQNFRPTFDERPEECQHVDPKKQNPYRPLGLIINS